jgi:hypothetical protein
LTKEPSLIRRAWAWLGELLAIHGPLLVVLGVSGLASATLVQVWMRRRRRDRWAAGACWVEITAPAEVDPSGAELFWRSLAGITDTPWRRRWRGQPHLVWEIHAHNGALRFGVWAPATIGTSTLAAAVRAAWPGAKVTTTVVPFGHHRAAARPHTTNPPPSATRRPPVPIPRHHPDLSGHVAAGVLRLSASEVLPLVSERLRVDPLRSVMAALDPIRDHTPEPTTNTDKLAVGGAWACIQVCARPATGRRLAGIRAQAGRVASGGPMRAPLTLSSMAGLGAWAGAGWRLVGLAGRGVLDLIAAIGAAPLHSHRGQHHSAPADRRSTGRSVRPNPGIVSAVNAKTATGPFWDVQIRYAVTLTARLALEYRGSNTEPDTSTGGEWARCDGWADAIGSAFAAHTAHNHLRRGRLRRPRAVMNQRRLSGGQLWSVPELAALAHLPVNPRTPGVTRAGAATIAPPPEIARTGRDGAAFTAAGARVLGHAQATGRPVALAVADRRHHIHMPGITGAGKTTALAQLALQDITQRQATLVIEPKGDLVDDLAPRIPASHRDRISWLDPTRSSAPPVINLLNPAYPGGIENLIGIFARLFTQFWGPRSEDLLRVACLTLRRHHQHLLSLNQQLPEPARVPVAVPHLGDVLELITNPRYRAPIIDHLHHQPTPSAGLASGGPGYLRSFWRFFDALPESAQAAAAGPLANKLRALLLRPFSAAVLTGITPPAPPGIHPYTGQPVPHPGQHTQDQQRPAQNPAAQRQPGQNQAGRPLNMTRLLDHGGILLARLAEGLLSAETTRLLGSLLVAHTWHALTARAGRPRTDRPDAALYLDEAQMFLNMPVRTEELLAQARGYHLSCVIAHQNLAQLPAELRAGLAANAATKLFFRVSPEDARALEYHVTPQLTARDLAHLDRYTVAARLHVDNAPTPAFTLTTPALPPLERREAA